MIDQLRLSIRVLSEHLGPDDLRRVCKAPPDWVVVKGELLSPRSERSARASANVLTWSAPQPPQSEDEDRLGLDADGRMASGVRHLVSIIDPDELKRLRSRSDLCAECWVLVGTESTQGGLFVEPEQLVALGELGIGVFLDVYTGEPDDEQGGTTA